MEILVTGSAGFIGFSLSKKLLQKGISVIGIDNLNTYYDVTLKNARNNELRKISDISSSKYEFFEGDISDSNFIKKIFGKFKIKYVVNLAAQAGVRYSIENPSAYIRSNIVGFNNIIEACKVYKIKHLIFASSSSVYGGNKIMPFKESQRVDHPISLYAATKRSNELIAHSYSHLFNLPCTGLRFFTVYGPWGRPDMALFLFTKSMLMNKPINIFNNGDMVRDFTYIDDITESIFRLLYKPPTNNKDFDFFDPNPSKSWCKYKIFNIGNSEPTPLIKYIEAIEKNLNVKSKKNYLPMQPGDVKATESDNSELEEWIKFKPKTKIEDGIEKFINWYKDFYKYD